MPTAIVLGATSLVGHYLLPLLAGSGYRVLALSRQPGPGDGAVHWLQADLAGNWPDTLQGEVLVSLAPLWLLAERLPELARRGVRRVIAFSSTSRFSKLDSTNAAEQALARRLAESEAALEAACGQAGIDWTILRPTLIYGARRDKNVAFIARMIERFGFFPLIGEARGGRQPVHAHDLAIAVRAALESSAAANRAYNLSGGETLSYREMVARIAAALGKPARLLTLPASLFALVIRLARVLPRFRHLHAEMAYRMNEDLCFDYSTASRDFGYAPRGFERPLD